MTERRLPKTAVENLVEDLASKANADLSNLDATGQAKFDAKANIALTNTPYTTNRILEIPQDIKLELNNGTLTLKAGSKVYVPNGFEADGVTPKFDIVTIESDLQSTRNTNLQEIYFVGTNFEFYQIPMQYCYSGSTTPSSFFGGSYAWWYDTTSNILKNTSDGGTTWVNNWSLPVCLATSNTTQITSIDQVFNGFGYIGSTTFILPGVKWQRCAQSVNYGKNADGTNASEIHSTSSVLLVNHPDTITSTHYICVADGGNAARYTSRGSKIVYYDESKNAWYNDYSETYVYIIPLLEEHTTAGRVDSFTPYSVDSVANSNLSNLSSAAASNLNSKGIRTVIETYNNGSNWYRIWSDGWIEQGGSTGLQGANSYTRTTVTFLKPFKDTNYTITNAPNKYSKQNGLSQAYPPFIYTKNTKTCVFGGFCWTDGFDWYACGY